ncbi:mechanosensitive ion channel family protein [Teredinibacter franksiae]|uniref:mechanosensitive ion channel family protein n=1 Tax=Teredinibacter franksiae TaxID=2761453 RepID=UPI0024836B43|nr:mechanosensitive ion channel domain-containing protein [Teredinibacter franksiae]
MTLDWLALELISIDEFKFTPAKLISFFGFLFFTFLLSKLVRRGLRRLQRRADVNSAAQVYALGRVLHYIILVVGFMFAVSAIGVDVSKLALLASALGIGIGLGLQSIVNNFVSGLVILFERSLKVGDFIELSSGLVGEVLEINMRSTLIRTNDNVDILVPNAELIGNAVTNWTLEESVRRFRIFFWGGVRQR